MTVDEMTALFEKHEDIYHKEVYVASTCRSDLRAFTLLNKLVPGTGDIIDAAEHDQIWLSVSLEDLAKVATEEDVIVLVRCGVIIDENHDCLSMFA
jgi:hypothetical protein